MIRKALTLAVATALVALPSVAPASALSLDESGDTSLSQTRLGNGCCY